MNLKSSRRTMVMLGVIACLLLALGVAVGLASAANPAAANPLYPDNLDEPEDCGVPLQGPFGKDDVESAATLIGQDPFAVADLFKTTAASGCDDSQYYGTIHSADIDGDGVDELLARTPTGMEAWRFNTTSRTWVRVASGGPFSDGAGWNYPRYHATIHSGDIDADGVDEVLGRGVAGMEAHSFITTTTSWVKVAEEGPWSEAEPDWYLEKYYATIHSGDIDGDGVDEVLGRGAAGMEAHRSITGTAWVQVGSSGPFSDAEPGWDLEKYYATIHSGDIDGDGVDEVLGRGGAGMEAHRFITGTDWVQVAEDGPFSGAGWNYAKYYATIHSADIDGDGVDEVLGRGPGGMEAWRVDITTTSWVTVAENGPWSDAAGWDLQKYYVTIHSGDIDGDGVDELLGRGAAGIEVHRFTGTGWVLVASGGPFNVGPGGGHYGGYAFAHDISYKYPEWMAGIPDDRRLSELSIPGTHESMAIHSMSFWVPWPLRFLPVCQQMYLENQLESGIRALDIRLARDEASGNDNLKVFHGLVDQFADFNDVLGKVVQFLEWHPTETVLMRITETDAGYTDPDDFVVRVRKYLTNWTYDNKPYGDWVWSPISWEPIALGGPFKDIHGWDKAQYYHTIHSGDIDGDGVDEVLGRHAAGMEAFDFITGTAWVQVGSSGPFKDIHGWDKAQYYHTVHSGDIDGDGKDEVLGRHADGMEAFDFITGTVWNPVAVNGPFSDADGWDLEQYYATIHSGDIDGDGKDEVLGRHADGMEAWRVDITTTSWVTVAVNGPFSDAAHWDEAKYYATIHSADIDGDGVDELLGRDMDGVQAWRFNAATTDWEPIALGGPFSNADGWDLEKYFATIHSGDIDGDGLVDELLGRGVDGMQAWRFNGVTVNPTLGEVRGKIVILDDFSGSTDFCGEGEPIATYWGLRYGYPCQFIQDDYSVKSFGALRNSKWPRIEEYLRLADEGDLDKFYINYLSGVGDIDPLPYQVASGHKLIYPLSAHYFHTDGEHEPTGETCCSGIDCASNFYPWPHGTCIDEGGLKCKVYWTGTNELTSMTLRNNPPQGPPRRWGIIMADFPGPELIDAIISANGIPPAAPSLSSPPDGGSTCDTTPTFQWSVSGVAWYRIQVDDNGDFSSPVISTTTVVARYTPDAALPLGTYYWRVQALSLLGNSAWSPQGQFAIVLDLPAPILSSPPDGASTWGSAPTFEWSPVSGSYLIQVDDDEDFSSSVISTTTSVASFTPGIFLPSGTYYWRVKALSDCGDSDWSANWQFVHSVATYLPLILRGY